MKNLLNFVNEHNMMKYKKKKKLFLFLGYRAKKQTEFCPCQKMNLYCFFLVILTTHST